MIWRGKGGGHREKTQLVGMQPHGQVKRKLKMSPHPTHTNCFVNGVARTGPTIAWLVMVPCLPALSWTMTVMV